MPVIATYHLRRQCGNIRPFCRPCTNSFKVTTCGPIDCDAPPPTVICLRPALESLLVPGSASDCCTPNVNSMVPRYMAAELALGSDGSAGNLCCHHFPLSMLFVYSSPVGPTWQWVNPDPEIQEFDGCDGTAPGIVNISQALLSCDGTGWRIRMFGTHRFPENPGIDTAIEYRFTAAGPQDCFEDSIINFVPVLGTASSCASDTTIIVRPLLP